MNSVPLRFYYNRTPPSHCRKCGLDTPHGISAETGLCFDEERQCMWVFIKWMCVQHPEIVNKNRKGEYTWVRQELGPYVDCWLEGS